MFSIFKKSSAPKSEKPKRKGPLYIYKPYENAMSFRVEFRGKTGYVYPGWSKTLLFKIEGDKVYSASDEGLSFIIKGRDIYGPSGEELMFRIAGGAVYSRSRELLYEIRDSIKVQGTL